MRVLILVLLCVLATPCGAEKPMPFAYSGRIVTVIQAYGGANPHWTVWAVQPQRVVVYEQSGRSGVPNKLLGEVALLPDQEAKLRQTVENILPALRGHRWFRPDVIDGISLSIGFTTDGSAGSDDIVLDNAWRPEFRDLCTLISSVVPSELGVNFEERILANEEMNRLPIVSQSISDYRTESQPKKEPWWKIWK